MNFEWDNNKREKNLAKHQIDFSDAALIFYDNDRIESNDTRNDYGETRYKTIGIVNDIVLCVVYTKRSEKYRIISARRARKDERKIYYLHAE